MSRTLLWTLHCRARSVERGDLDDPVALDIARSFGPALGRTFGRADPVFAVRAKLFDGALQDWLRTHPGATVISLGEGLETQRHRVRGYGRWISVDLPEAIAVRERFLPPDERHLHVAASATDLSWLDHLGPDAFVVAQGLLMYLERPAVQQILTEWSGRARAHRAGGGLMFDVVPSWLAAFSRLQAPVTPTFRVPPMPWGTSRSGLEAMLARTLPPGHELRLERWTLPSGPVPFGMPWRTWVAEVTLPEP